jgi:DNA replicative helicase MCM subunit Mcm2 (Cdc46/Mcm family)
MQLGPQDYAMVEQLGAEGHLFDRLAASIAPEIYGMLEVKKVGREEGGV